MAEDEGVGLSKFLQELRKELQRSMEIAKQEPALAFEMTKLDVELQVTAERSVDGSGKVKFWVIEAGAGGKIGDKSVQTIKMSLQPIVHGAPTNVRVSSPSRRPKE
jgi:hypothetical protein